MEAPVVSKDYKREMYRKAVHLSSLWMPALILFCPDNRIPAAVFLFLFLLDLAVEYGNYKKQRWVRFLFLHLFFGTLRRNELQHKKFVLTGSVYVFASAFICSLAFTKIIAAIALTIMIVSDALAALIGKSIGKHKIYKEKTLEGTLAFFLSALAIMFLYSPYYPFSANSVLAAFIATIFELYNGFILDDNFWVPLVVGTILTLCLL